jgi:hypothetical protein
MIDDIVQPIAEPVPVKGKLHRIAGTVGIGDIAFNGIAQLFLIFWAVMVIFPFLWMVMTSFKTDPEILFSPWNLPDTLQWNNFSRAWNEAHIGRYFVNSLIVIIPSLAGTLLVSSMAAYVLARIDVSGLPGPGAALLPGPGLAHDGHLPGSDPRLYRLFVAIHDLLPDRFLPDPAH